MFSFLSIFVLGFAFLVIGIVVLFIVKRSKDDALIPSGKIIFDDLHGSSFSLYSHKYPLVGKPDLVIKKGWKYLPVEVKTGNHHFPKLHHVMQLMAYCQLVKEHYHKATPYGYLIYIDTGKRFKIPYRTVEKKRLKKSLQDMNRAIINHEIIRNHENKR
ncbi:MAG: Dna2/Cas4 domain-containing protein, partial [Candidatus Thermoplasmatota archaeon]|nr:Dna2/Cas4 domain-containing protein [Candidatus Thermoplasmatota archaeon]